MDDRAPRAVGAEDAHDQVLVLEAVMELHPARLTMGELVRELEASGDVCGVGRVEAAVRDLIGSGLVHREGLFVSATRAVVRLEELRSSGGV